MFKTPVLLSLIGGTIFTISTVAPAVAQSDQDKPPAYLWQNTTLDTPNVLGGKTPLFAYVEVATSRPLITGICRSDGETTLAEVNLAAEVNSAQDTPINVEFAVFGPNKFEGQVQRPADQPAFVKINVPLGSSLFTSLRQQNTSAYRIAGKIQNLELTGSSAALSAFAEECQGVSQAFASLKAAYATCQTLRPRSRSILRKTATIVNNSGSVRLMQRLSSSGRLEAVRRLEPGQRIRLDSRVHTIYQFSDAAGNCIQRQRVRSSSSTIVLTAPNKLQL